MRTFTVVLLLSCSLSFAQGTKTVYRDARTLTVEGQGWTETASPYDRLPAKAEKTVRPAVWNLSKHSAGIAVRFVTDSPVISAKWNLTSATLAMPHMPATGVSGLDLYARDENGKWRWVANGRPSGKENEKRLVSGLTAESREFMLYLPLYNGVTSVEIGVPENRTLEPGRQRAAERRKPIVFYGTSITQGGCCSRPGMVHTAILGRQLDRPVINLGFSGNGRMEKEVAELIAEIDAAVYVIDCLPNIQAKDVTARTETVVQKIRKAHQGTPIVLVEDRNYTDSYFLRSKRQRNAASQAALRAEYEKLTASGVRNLLYITGPNLLGEDGEGTVDSSHPTDLGFLRQAVAFRKVLGPILTNAK